MKNVRAVTKVAKNLPLPTALANERRGPVRQRGQLPSPWSSADQWQSQEYKVLARYLLEDIYYFSK